MDDIADLIRRLESLIRYGTIAEVQMAPPRVRVKSGGLTSTWLPWFAPRAGTTTEWDPPTVGEQCVLFSPSGNPATGVVLVGLFSDAHPAPSSSPDEHVRDYPDGARITYNHATGALSATGIKTALVQAAEKSGKPIAVICHGAWLLVSAGLVKGKAITSWPSLQDDIRNAGGDWQDQAVVRDGNLISSRKPDDLPAFNQALLESLAA